jgi:hypothetical protein
MLIVQEVGGRRANCTYEIFSRAGVSMSNRNDYNEKEWTFIVMAPLKVAILASEADTGFIAHVRETAAYPDAVTAAYEKFRDNELVVAILNDEETGVLEEKLQDRVEKRDKNTEFTLFQSLKSEVMRAVAMVTEKSPQELSGFKEMLYFIADVIVNASGEGFMGGGDKVSQKEKAFMRELKESLVL